MNDRKIYVTIDVEMDSDIHWGKKYPPVFSSVVYGIPHLLRPIWDRYNINPIYFVSPEVVRDDTCCDILQSEINKGAIIGAHLHPEQIPAPADNMSAHLVQTFPCVSCDYETEFAKIQALKTLIADRLSYNAIWYRAARFGADLDTLKILSALGFKYDSSFTPGIDWSDKGGPNHANIELRPKYYEELDITEYPITICGKRFGRVGSFLPDHWLCYAWLRPTHMTCIEQRHILRHLVATGVNTGVMMFHSMEVMIDTSPYVRNRLMQQYYLSRLEKTLSYAINTLHFRGDI